MKAKHSFINVLTGSDLSTRRLALMQIKSNQPGPVIWLTGAVHGDEIGGIIIIQEIFKRLQKNPLLKGSIFALPLMNPIGFETVSRGITLSSEDLNRSFPGDDKGTLAQRMAATIFQNIIKTKPSLVLDIHNDWLNSIPYTLIDPNPGVKHKNAYEQTKKFSTKLGFPVINEKEEPKDIEILKTTLSGSLILSDIPALTLEIGGAVQTKEKDINDGVKAVWDLLTSLNMVKPHKQKFNFQAPKNYLNKILRYSHQPDASTSGIIRFLVNPGQEVKKGQPLAKIYNVFGKLEETLICQNNAVVLGHADSAVAYPGAEILALGIL